MQLFQNIILWCFGLYMEIKKYAYLAIALYTVSTCDPHNMNNIEYIYKKKKK